MYFYFFKPDRKHIYLIRCQVFTRRHKAAKKVDRCLYCYSVKSGTNITEYLSLSIMVSTMKIQMLYSLPNNKAIAGLNLFKNINLLLKRLENEQIFCWCY